MDKDNCTLLTRIYEKMCKLSPKQYESFIQEAVAELRQAASQCEPIAHETSLKSE